MDPDPWKWSVQDVQQFFRNDAAAYILDMPYGRLPQLDPFLTTLNDNDVTGVVLLTTIDATSLRDDCGVSKLGERSAVLRCITKLRRQSAIHIAQNAPFGLQTPPQQPLQAVPPQQPLQALPPISVAPEAAAPSTELAEDAGEHVRSGEVEVEDSRGRKRRKLDLSKPEAPPKAKRTLVDLTAASVRKENFGDLAFPVDEIFYGQTGFGREIGQLQPIGDVLVLEPDRREGLEDNNFQFTEQNKTIGESQYVYSYVRHFMNRFDKGITVHRRGRQALGFLPYRDIPGLETRTAIVLQFKNESEDAVAVRENAAYLLSGFDLHEPPQQSPGNNDYLLEKYKPSEVLPLFGDSEIDYGDDESESLTTSDDDEQQAEEVDDLEDPDLTPARCDEVIEDVIKECIADWNNKLPRLEQKRAWTVWKKTKQSRTIRDALIQGAEARIEHLTKRLDKMKAEMLFDTWQSAEKLRNACGIMEPTIEDREEQRWMITIWRRRQEPAHVVRHGTHANKPTLQTSATEKRDKGIFVHPDDRFSVSPAPVTTNELGNDAENEIQNDVADEANNHTGDEIQYDADDEVFHTPGNSPAISPDIRAFVVPTPEEMDFELGAPDEERGVKEQQDRDLPVNTPNFEGASSSKDDNYVPEADDSECELPSPRTFVGPRKNRTPVKAIDLTTLSDSPTPKKPGRTPKSATKKVVEPKGDPTNATVSEVESWDLSALIRNQDRQRILIKLLTEAGPKLRDRLDSILRSPGLGRSVFVPQLQPALQSHRSGTSDPDLRKDIAPTMMSAAEIYIRWLIPSVIEQGRGTFDKQAWNDVLKPNQFALFTSMLGSILVKKESKLFIAPKSTPLQLGSSCAPIDVSSGSSDQRSKQRQSPSRKRKREVKRSAAAQDSRTMALNRQQRFNESQTTNSSQLEAMIASDPSHSSIEINPAKKADDDFIYICDRIARKMKAHQIDGTRFLWREVTAEGDEGAQGCILAHTMGLGKTMQTISLLVALNEAAASSDPEVYKQLPTHLRPKDVRGGKRQLRVLILCPPGVLQNWRREINEWAPNQLGNIIILDSPSKGIQMLSEWMRVGGALLAGYQMFQSTLSHKLDQKSARTAEEIAALERILLEGPEIVVADEAQHIKNDKAGISMLASCISTQSRIALTGTPMSNDVDEIYALMSWVAPGFLGDAREFRDHFGEPIKQGLYVDSTAEQRRKSFKRLTGLHIEIQPKIDRANIEVLRGSLKPKIEYVITVPLTPVQDALYRKYIKTLLSGDRTENASQVAFFGWLEDLTLLTNHPQCLRKKLIDPPRRKAKKPKQDGSGLDVTSRHQTPSTTTESGSVTPLPPGIATDTEQLAEDGAVTESAEGEQGSALDPTEVQEILHDFPDNMEPELSAKVTIFLKLLSFSLELQDKVLVFSSSIPTIDYLGTVLQQHGERFGRIDGSTTMDERTEILKGFHNNGKFDKHGLNTMLVSSRAGGVGLNIQDANRVFIFDFRFNPTIEEQAIGRAYRLGQTKPVFVYRFVTGGTFETNIYNKQLFKSSLSARVVDKKNPRRNAERNAREYVYEPKRVPQENLTEEAGKDPFVLDRLLEQHGPEEEGKSDTMIRAIKTMETLQEEAKDTPLDEEEQKEVNLEVEQRRPRGKKAGNTGMFPPPATAAPVAPASRMPSFPAPPTATRRPPSTMASASGNPSLVARLPPAGILRRPPSTLARASVNGSVPHAHPMGGLPMPQQPNNGSN